MPDKLKQIFLFSFIALFSCISRAQSYYFKNYQVTNGLSSNTVTSITQDKKGFMWFGTRNGLNRFDGNTFKVFQHNAADSSGLGSNSVFSLYEDNKERLWIGTYKGIYIYDPVLEKFSAFKLVSQGEVRYIKGDDQQNIWIVADLALYRFNQQTGKLSSYPFEKMKTTLVSIAGNGTVWAATNTGIIKKYEPATDKFIDHDISGSLKKNSANEIQDIYPVNDSLLMVGTMTKVLLFNTRTATTKNVFEELSPKKDVQVHKILQQSKDEYWIGTESGLYILTITTGKAEIIKKTFGNPYSITDNVIYTLYNDAEGNTWIGTFFGGINYYSKQYNQFQKYFPFPGPGSLSGNLVHEICADPYNDLWVGTEDAGLNHIDSKTGTITHFMPNGKGSISYHNIHGLLADSNELWIGTYEHGLDVMDIQTKKIIRHYNAGNGPNDLKSNFIVTIYKTRQSEILIGTWIGMFKYNRDKNNFSPVPSFTMQIQAIHEDAEGTIWAASYGNGVYYYNPVSGKKGFLNYNADDTNSLINNYVNNLFADSKKNIWFCTEGGLCKYDPFAKKITRYTQADGLPDNQTFRMLEDNAGNLWITTAKGLVEFNPTIKSFKTYSTSNGLLTNQFNYNSAFKKNDGTLYFGSVKGMISFDPSRFSKNPFTPPVYITGIQVNNKEINLKEENSPLRKSVTYTKNIILPYDQSTISLDIAALSYTMPELNEYAYKMDGYDKEWTPLKTNRKIYYTKLPPGKYTFRLKGAGSSGAWNERETLLNIRITPPFWATTWAYLLYALIASGIVFIILRYYYLAIKEKNKRKIAALEIEKEREIYNSKIEFFTNVAHEIRTPLTLIKMPLDKLIKQEAENNAINESLQMMKKNTNRLIDLTNQLLDFRKAEANKFSLNFTRNDVNDLVNEAFLNFKPAAEEKKLVYKLEMPRISLQAYVDPEAFKKILTNLLHNAIKYADKNVIVKLLPFSSEDTVFTIEVKNDGYCIPYHLKEKIFEPFYRIKETEEQPGTGIGLPLSRSLAELHKGVLDLKQPVDNYNIFSLSIPIHQETEIDLQGKEIIEAEKNLTDLQEEEVIIGSKPLILIVEDNKEILSFIQKELKTDYNILKAYNGQEALGILLKENVQLVISDIMMPVMDGIELCKKIKTDLQYSHIPIILLTARNTLHSKIEGLESGADAYIEKPFALEHLQAQISNLLANRNKLKEYFAHSPLTHIKGIACTKADSNFLEELNTIIYENITDMDIDVDKLAKMMNMSRPTFYRKIKGLSNPTPNELINLSRLKKAAALLAEGTYKINEVASIVGYSLHSNFARDFHKQFGMTPSAYIQNL